MGRSSVGLGAEALGAHGTEQPTLLDSLMAETGMPSAEVKSTSSGTRKTSRVQLHQSKPSAARLPSLKSNFIKTWLLWLDI